jgi:hypothetical protein
MVLFPEPSEPDDDPDGFDKERRRDVLLRMVAIRAKQERDDLATKLTPLELAEHDLAAMLAFQAEYETGGTTFSLTPSNTRALIALVNELRANVDRLREG